MFAKKIIILLIITLFSNLTLAEDTFTFKPYGRLKATTIYANNPVNSFNFINASAPTSASDSSGTTTGIAQHDNLWSFQVAQSRVGTDIINENVFANLEFDFIDFSVSSPTTEAKPRLRKAYAGYNFNSNHQIQMGQDWDTFSPLAPNTLDYVGLFFNSGNAGFMRQQLKWKYTQDNFKSELSLGMPGKNPNTEFNEIENTSAPALAYMMDWNGLGASLFYSSIKKTGLDRKSIEAVNLFYKGKWGSQFNFVSEFYWGKNMNEAALLTLSHIVGNKDLTEIGGYLSGTYDMNSSGLLTLTYGFAQLLNKEDAGVYTYNIASKKITEDGITDNQLVRLFWNLPVSGKLSFVTEFSYFKTKRNIIGMQNLNETFTIESGLLLTF